MCTHDSAPVYMYYVRKRERDCYAGYFLCTYREWGGNCQWGIKCRILRRHQQKRSYPQSRKGRPWTLRRNRASLGWALHLVSYFWYYKGSVRESTTISRYEAKSQKILWALAFSFLGRGILRIFLEKVESILFCWSKPEQNFEFGLFVVYCFVLYQIRLHDHHRS